MSKHFVFIFIALFTILHIFYSSFTVLIQICTDSRENRGVMYKDYVHNRVSVFEAVNMFSQYVNKNMFMNPTAVDT